jgi:hypothetical protein
VVSGGVELTLFTWPSDDYIRRILPTGREIPNRKYNTAVQMPAMPYRFCASVMFCSDRSMGDKNPELLSIPLMVAVGEDVANTRGVAISHRVVVFKA